MVKLIKEKQKATSSKSKIYAKKFQTLKSNNNLQNDPIIKSQIAAKEKELWELENKQKK